MWETIKTAVVLPTLARAGFSATGYLVGIGASQQHADWVGTGLVGAALIALDLLASWLLRKVNGNKAVAKAMASIWGDRDYRGIGGGQ